MDADSIAELLGWLGLSKVYGAFPEDVFAAICAANAVSDGFPWEAADGEPAHVFSLGEE